MNLNSKYFDMIRIARPTKSVGTATRHCDWPDCREMGNYPAPAAPRTSGRRYFCLEHISRYNQSYNFFEGMDSNEVEDYQRAASTGHRPTWSLGVRRAKQQRDWLFEDALGIMRGRGDGFEAHASTPDAHDARGAQVHISQGQKRALDVLHLPPHTRPEAVRKQYKALVKKYHPDTNGGARKYEDRFQKTVQAYNYLKASGFC